MIVYVLEATTLCGGVKVVFEHVRELNKAGIKAVVASVDKYPDWLYFKSPFYHFNSYREIFQCQDFSSARFVLTFYRQILEAEHFRIIHKCFHFCQGYEGVVDEAKPLLHEIEKAYKVKMSGFTVSDRLSKRIQSLFPSKKLYNAGQAIDNDIFYPGKELAPAMPFRIILMGSLYNSVKDVKKGLNALKILREKLPVEIIRISLSDTKTEEENIAGEIKEYYYLLKPDEVGNIMRSCHAILVPSNNGEGFGLPVVEAMACGLPSVITKTDSFSAIDPLMKSSIFVGIGDEYQMAEALLKLFGDRELRSKIRNEGLKTASKYHYRNVVANLISIFGKNLTV